MDTASLKRYAPEARRSFMDAVRAQAARYGITAKGVEPATVQGDVLLVGGQAYPKAVAEPRRRLVERIEEQGFKATMEAVAYTWFNRLVALRYMELHGYLDHGYRVLSHPEGERRPEVLEHASDVDLPGLDRARVIELKLDGTRDEELYRLMLKAQCNALHQAMPFLFEMIGDETELLLPANLLHTDSLVRQLVESIEEDLWQNIEIIGWLYQFYISEKKDQVIGKVAKSEDIPAATQLFTPNWIVKYMVQNSLGAQWLATYPESPLKGQMEYYIEPAEQTDEVKAQLAAITPSQLNPEELTLIDPACGSGHILVEAYELFKAIYLERGYRQRDVPQLILEKNLFGLDIDPRAAQLSGFALMMKARADDRRLFERGVKLNVMALVDSTGFDAEVLTKGVELADYGLNPEHLTELKDLFERATTFGSLILVPEGLAKKLPALIQLSEATSQDLFVSDTLKRFGPLVQQVGMLAAEYDAVVANPPYMGSKYIDLGLKRFLSSDYPTAGADIYPAFIERALGMVRTDGCVAMITLQNWLYISGMRDLRHRLLSSTSLRSVVQVGFNSFPSMNSKFAVAAISVILPRKIDGWAVRFLNLNMAPPSSDKNAVFLSHVKGRRHKDVMQHEFDGLPGNIVAYTLTSNLRAHLSQGPSLGNLAPPMRGLATGDNAQFVRSWAELAICDIELGRQTVEETLNSSKKWFPYNMGGKLRKWYGNLNFVVNWQEGGRKIRNLRTDTGRLRSRPQNVDAYFHQGITWKEIGIDFCGRFFPVGMISDQTSDFLIANSEECFGLLAFLNSSTASHFIGALNPTLHFNVGTLRALPILPELFSRDLIEGARTAVTLAKEEWDEKESSWDFKRGNLLETRPLERRLIKSDVSGAIKRSHKRIDELNDIVSTMNETIADIYGVPRDALDKQSGGALGIEVLDENQSIQELVSYAVGCMMGRYSLDEPGLIYALSGNEGFDPSRYPTFPADDDGIVPLTDTEWFADDATNRVVEFLSVAWDASYLEENLTFLASNLSPRKGESSRDTIRRYLCDSFFKDHLQTYKKRPIYWLFSSGKQKAFQCLVYLHRYNEGTLARMRSEYVIPLEGKIAARIEQLGADIQAATSSAHRKRLEKEQTKLQKQQVELLAFDEKLRHYADRRISLDLDEGVKVNYGKFGDLLLEVKAVHGQKAEET